MIFIPRPRGSPLGLLELDDAASCPSLPLPLGRNRLVTDKVELGQRDLPLPEQDVGRAEAPLVATQKGRAQRSPLPATPTGPEPQEQAPWTGRGERGLQGEEGRGPKAPPSRSSFGKLPVHRDSTSGDGDVGSQAPCPVMDGTGQARSRPSLGHTAGEGTAWCTRTVLGAG